MAGTGRLTNPQIVQLASAIPARVMKPIAEGFMDIPPETLVNLEDTHRSDAHGFSREVIRTWSYRNPGNDQIEKLASLLFQAAKMEGILLNTVKISEILGVTEEQVLGGSVSSPAATSTAQQTRAVASGASSQPGVQKELDGSKVLALSEVLVDQDDLRKLALNGLKVEAHVLRKHVSNSRDKYTEAAYNLLEDWLKQQENRRVAYTKLIAALKNVGLFQLIEEAGL